MKNYAHIYIYTVIKSKTIESNEFGNLVKRARHPDDHINFIFHQMLLVLLLNVLCHGVIDITCCELEL